MRRRVAAAVWALLAAGAGAHPAPTSRLELAFAQTAVRAEYWIPVSELAFARAADPRGGFADYLLRHLAAETPGGEPWKVSVAGVREATYEGHAYLVAELSLLPPPGGSPRAFVLLDDAVTHEVRNHVVFVVTRRESGSDLLGLLQYPTRRLEIVAR